ncbi:nuclear transport factor 2 family protein [Phreatobacter stygius]|uniref:Nuclear transport factor 2 family protein n=2 Tax=Phreatobacter stygius TaxID=1940610 RepID=A0A4D7BMK4_9HYPH|nr:nuclear transport factor 2 family protein [Phreatobacter stygius]
MPDVIRTWHQIVEARDPKRLDGLLADDVVFVSPVVHTPQTGKAVTAAYLTAALQVLNNGHFRYLGAWYGEASAVLEFETTVDGIVINGVDMIGWNEAGKITHFKVMARPLKAINLLHQLMGAMLQKMAGRP